MGASAVALGAVGAHGLHDLVTADRLSTWETGSRYHLIHAVVLMILALNPRASPWPFRLILSGTVVFALSLYGLVLLDKPLLGAITPVGGVLLIAGWASLVFHGFGRAALPGGVTSCPTDPDPESRPSTATPKA
jgi:uncharacterized membrane protein YgdD (TMEM256/DUF423 family)